MTQSVHNKVFFKDSYLYLASGCETNIADAFGGD